MFVGSGEKKLVMVAALVLAAGSVHAQVLEPGAKINKAVTANITPNGLDFLTDQAMLLVPDHFDVPPMSGSEPYCFGFDIDYSVYEGQPENGLSVEVTSATLEPQQGHFLLSVAGTVTGTGVDDPPSSTGAQTFTVARVQYSGCGTNCDEDQYSVLRLNPMPFAVSTTVDLEMMTDPLTGEPVIEATTTLDRDDISIDTTKIDAAGCAAIDVLVSILKPFIGNAVKDQIIDMVNEDMLPAIEEGFGSLRYDDTIQVGDAGIAIKVLPSALDIRPTGTSISLSSQMEAQPVTSCIPIEPNAGSAFTAGEPPLYDEVSPGGSLYDVAAALSDDLVNQALFSAWHAGLLCHTMSEMGGSVLTTDMLTLAGLAGPLNRLDVPDGAPMVIVIKGYRAPVASFSDDPHIDVRVERLEVSVFTMIQDRMARLVALDLQADAGVNVLIDAANVLSFALDLAPEDITGTVSYTEIVSAEDAESLLTLLPGLVSQFLPDVAGSLPTIDLGSLAGLALVNPEVVAEQGQGGVPNDTLSFYTGLEATGAGCGASDPSGCGVGSTGGCSLGGPRAASQLAFLAMMLAPLAMVLRRRRE